MKNDSPAPTSSSASDAQNGMDQLPVRSTAAPNTRGDRIPATPKPKFIIPLAVPAYCGAMSIGTAQIGATTSSEKKNASDRHTATVVRSWVRTTGTRNMKAPTIPTMIRLRRAACKLPVLR